MKPANYVLRCPDLVPRLLWLLAGTGVLLVFGMFGPAAYADAEPAGPSLRVCADPNNLPFSNRHEEGFENRLASMLADEMQLDLEYTWHAQRRGFLRNTLQAGVCDLVMGVPEELEMILPTRPYFRSTYVFLYPAALSPGISSFDDARLKHLRIGIHLVGDDGSNTPPELALAARGIINNVAGYMIQGNYQDENPPARLVEAVASGEVDVAALWGPLAGYFAKRQQLQLAISPVEPAGPSFTFAIAMGVRPDDLGLKNRLDDILAERQEDIERLLLEYGVPLLPLQ